MSARTDVSRHTGIKIKNGLIFAPKKLELLLQERRELDEASDAPSMLQLMQSCWVSPLEAVQDWGVMPQGVEISESVFGEGFILIQTDFKCLYPGVYATREEAQQAAAKLLMGRIIEGSGDFVYRGQAYTQMKALDSATLSWPTSIPRVNTPEKEGAQCSLERIGFKSGFALLNEQDFEHLALLQKDWETTRTAIRKHILQNERNLKGAFDMLAQRDGNTHSASKPSSLTVLYPELTAWPALRVHRFVHEYCEHVSSTHPKKVRDFDLLAYVAGNLIAATHLNSLTVGYAFLYAWLNAGSYARCAEIAQEVGLFESRLMEEVSRVEKILARLERDELTLGEQGKLIALHNALRIAFNSGSSLFH